LPVAPLLADIATLDGAAMTFPSVLFAGPLPDGTEPDREPEYFADLNLDQFLDAVTESWEAYGLRPYFSRRLTDPRAVQFRQDVLKDLEDPELSTGVRSFSEQLGRVRGLLRTAGTMHNQHHRHGWFLDAVERYCQAVRALADALTSPVVRSEGLRALRGYATDYLNSERFATLARELEDVRRSLATVRYAVQIKGSRITVMKQGEELDFSSEVEATFAKFQQGNVKDYRVKFPERDTNHVLAHVLDLVARHYPEIFSALAGFCTRHEDFIDECLSIFDREVHFYLAYLDLIEPLRRVGLPFCYPEVSDAAAPRMVESGFDLVLARQRVSSKLPVVTNGFRLDGPERIIVVTGPNQGGKTTFARMFGQLHHLTSLGLAIPGRSARLPLPDQLFTHFERAESLATLHGKLEDELVRVHDTCEHATARSVVVMNETFTSTTVDDALYLGKKVVELMTVLGVAGVYVTFIDELSALNEATVSMVAAVDPRDPTRRTFKVVQQAADGLAYAGAIAEKYGLTYPALKAQLSG
jgi:DNA mismatch repair protein MutS